jgi:hypothetical protein
MGDKQITPRTIGFYMAQQESTIYSLTLNSLISYVLSEYRIPKHLYTNASCRSLTFFTCRTR